MSLRGIIDIELRSKTGHYSRPCREPEWNVLDAASNHDIPDARKTYSLTWEEYEEVERRRVVYAEAHGGKISGAECDRIRDDYAREIGRLR